MNIVGNLMLWVAFYVLIYLVVRWAVEDGKKS